MVSKVAALLLFTFLVGCNGGNDSDDSSTEVSSVSDTSDSSTDDTSTTNDSDTSTDEVQLFPNKMMVSSPTQRTSSVSFSNGVAFDDAVTVIDESLSSTQNLSSHFDPTYFFTDVISAECFGPSVDYTDHSDGVVNNSGTLPSGDVGIWLETMPSGEVCAAAELNAQMKGTTNRVLMSLISFGGLIAVANANSISLPPVGTSILLTTEMNALGLTNTTFNLVSLSQSLSNVWTYTIDFNFIHNSVSKNIVLSMEHDPGSDLAHYEGVIQYQMDDFYDPSGNCSVTSGTGSDITHNGSVHYKRDNDNITFQHRYGMLCNHGQTAFSSTLPSSSTFLTKTVLNPNDSSNQWKNNFSIVTANFDKTHLGGEYAYIWQAGDLDAASRTLLVGLNSNQTGEAYYGYGNRVQTSTVGSITGFYCNWAGPGSGHTVHQYAQRQHMTFNSSSQVFEPSNVAASDITYAPNDSCTYTGSGLNAFRYDRDIDRDLTDETDATAQVYPSGTAPSGSLEFDLMDVDYAGTVYATVMDVILARGYTAPTYP